MVEESSLLGGEPLAEVFVPAVSEAADKVTDVIVFIGREAVFASHPPEAFLDRIKNSLYVELMLL